VIPAIFSGSPPTDRRTCEVRLRLKNMPSARAAAMIAISMMSLVLAAACDSEEICVAKSS
jgi:hypothetical protein